MISSESCDLLKFKLDASHTVCQPELRSAAANMKSIIMGFVWGGGRHTQWRRLTETDRVNGVGGVDNAARSSA